MIRTLERGEAPRRRKSPITKGEDGGARTWAVYPLSGQLDDLAARVSSLTFCGNLVPVSAQSQGDLMKVVRSWKGRLWKSAIDLELERPKSSRGLRDR